ncbi:flagellar biosynthesis protein FlgD [Meridianimarinicoccus roseus]|jgi:flagellar basal-body rod modification protein FlgD|uniref:Basal-body rod modification protein FlgD n=1 Tax=Meridianimarinicoccus roseus TaxID=2072018 RepID=A0A2V2LBK4_9RHOB|nr:flagellar hook capping FlgD N-terminal domain-containing protein [Meridianimarinicoccus roseus]PWR02572.1 flagellar biosynthesis protein FlgD [Meridianimarinicoccus roseus]
MNTITNTQTGTPVQSAAANGAPAPKNATSDLGQQDFLTLMTTQLKNQDPFKPMESGEFLGTMAQFSTVSGIGEVNSTLDQIGDQIGEFRIATASNLLGQEVLVPGNTARPDANGRVSGAVELSTSASVLTVSYSDARDGTLLHTQTLGAQEAGMVGFSWDDVPSRIREAGSPVLISVSATGDAGTEVLGPSVFAQVMSVTMAPGADDYQLDVKDHGTVLGNQVKGLR